MDSDEVHEAFDSGVGEGHGLFVAGAVDPDQSVFGFHLAGDVGEPVLVFAKLGSDAGDGSDAVDFIDVHVRRPRRRPARAAISRARVRRFAEQDEQRYGRGRRRAKPGDRRRSSWR
jgi:hypothetical protein